MIEGNSIVGQAVADTPRPEVVDMLDRQDEKLNELKEFAIDLMTRLEPVLSIEATWSGSQWELNRSVTCPMAEKIMINNNKVEDVINVFREINRRLEI